MTTQTAIMTASVLGTMAFNNGKAATPSLDSDLMNIIAQHENKEIGASIPIIKAWINSWHAANLNK